MRVALRSKKLADGSKSLYLDIYVKGLRSYEFLGIKLIKNDPNRKHKLQFAEGKRAKRELELMANYHDVPRNFNGDDDFLEYFKNNATDASFTSIYNSFNTFVKHKTIKGKLPFKLISEKLIEDYKTYLISKHKNSTAWVYLIKLKTILNKAIKDRIIEKSPGKFISIRRDEIDKVFLTEEELKTLVKTDSENIEIKKAYLFSCFTGLRISDVKSLTWSQIQENKLFFRQKKTKGLEFLPLAKTAIKYLYLNIDKNNIKQDEKVFNLSFEKSINNALRDWVTKAEINKYLTFHSARHTFATLSLSYGIDLYTLSKMMGHKSIKMTEIYARIINKTAEEAIAKLPEL